MLKKTYLTIFSLLLMSFGTCSDLKFMSQKGQDQWVIEDVFNYERDGFFVDLGAADGKNISNTYLLEKELGWNGICIEANPNMFKNLKMHRNCILVKTCIDQTNHEVDFRVDNKLHGGIVAEDTDNRSSLFKFDRNTKKITLLSFQTKTLEQVLDENNAPSVIDYLSLDVEGAETRIMKNFPFDRYTFLAMTIERPTPELNEIFFRNGYVFVKNSRYDSFYVHQSIKNLESIQKEPFEQVPPKCKKIRRKKK